MIRRKAANLFSYPMHPLFTIIDETALCQAIYSKMLYSSKSQSSLNFYEVLNIKPEATQQEIKSAYYSLCKEFHPDSTAVKDFDAAAMKFLQVSQAYETLSNNDLRARYDENLGLHSIDYTGIHPSTSRRTQEDIARDLKMYAQFRSNWRKQSSRQQSSYNENYGSAFQEGNQDESARQFRRDFKFNQRDFDAFYKTYKKRVNMEAEYAKKAARDDNINNFKTKRDLHMQPYQIFARKFYEEFESGVQSKILIFSASLLSLGFTMLFLAISKN